MIETKPAADVIIDHFSEVIFFPFRLAAADRSHSHETFSFHEISCKLRTCGAHWHTGNALVTEIGLRGAGPVTSHHWAKLQLAQAHAYFHPFIRQFLFDTTHYSNDYRMAFHRTDITNLEIQLGGKLGKSDDNKDIVIALKVKRCELEFIRMGIGALAIEVESTSSLQLNQVQQIQSQLRRTFSPYFDDYVQGCSATVESPLSNKMPRLVALIGKDKDGKRLVLDQFENGPVNSQAVDSMHLKEFHKRFKEGDNSLIEAIMPDSVPVLSHWQYLLKPLMGAFSNDDRQMRYVPLGDDRLPTMSYIAARDPREISRGDWVRLCFADEPGTNNLPYAWRFLKDFEAKYCYDRYWYHERETQDAPSRILNCGMTFCFVGSSSDGFFFTNHKNGAIATFRTIYSRLGLLAHLQKAAMLTASIRISELSERSPYQNEPPNYIKQKGRIGNFYREFIEFTHVYWFDEVTPQIQGIELFSAWQNHLGTKALHSEVRQELTDLTSTINSQNQEDLAKRTLKITIYAGAFAIVSIAVAVMSMDPFKAPLAPLATEAKLEKWASIGFTLLSVAGIAVVILIAVAAISGLVRFFQGPDKDH